MKYDSHDIFDYDINTLSKYIHTIYTDYPYRFLDCCKPYLDIEVIYLYLQNLQDFQLKHIWTSLLDKWRVFQTKHQDDPLYQKSIYSKQSYDIIHTELSPLNLDQVLTSFIKKDNLKAIFTIQMIFEYGCPYLS